MRDYSTRVLLASKVEREKAVILASHPEMSQVEAFKQATGRVLKGSPGLLREYRLDGREG